MTKFSSFLTALALVFGLTACSGEAPLTEAEEAEKYGMTIEEYRENKEAAARMNMTVEEHLEMGHGTDHSGMDHDMDMGN